MKWFKHETHAGKDECIRNLIHSHGIRAYGIYMILLELCAEKIDKTFNPTFQSEWPPIEYLCASRRATVQQVLNRCATLNLLNNLSDDQQINITIPNLLKRLDEYMEKSRHSPDSVPSVSGIRSKKKEVRSKNKRKRKERERHTPNNNATVIPPPSDGVTAYFAAQWPATEREAATFFDYYATNGWRTKHGQMRNWQAAARNWMRRHAEFHPTTTHEPRPKPFPVRTPEPDRVSEPA